MTVCFGNACENFIVLVNVVNVGKRVEENVAM